MNISGPVDRCSDLPNIFQNLFFFILDSLGYILRHYMLQFSLPKIIIKTNHSVASKLFRGPRLTNKRHNI